LRLLLKGEGYRTQVAISPAAALDVLEKNEIDQIKFESARAARDGDTGAIEEAITDALRRNEGDSLGATVDLQPLLLAGDGDAVFEGDKLSSAAVKAEIVEHLRGPKLRVFKFKPKRGYKRRTGHRQELTRIKITSIKG